MYTRRTARAVTTIPIYQPNPLHGQQDGPIINEKQTSSPAQPSDPDMESTPLPPVPVAAERKNGAEKPKYRRLPVPIRRKRRNKHLARLVAPKSALMLLNELKPGVQFNIEFSANSKPMVAEAIHDNEVIGKGFGQSKAAAKNAAAESALKKMVHSILSKAPNPNNNGTAEEPEKSELDEAVDEENGDTNQPDTDQLPWAGLASFALYRLFRQWHEEGMPLAALSRSTNLGIPGTTAPPPPPKVPVALPPNANDMHPVSLLHQLHPGIQVETLDRPSPQGAVTVGYRFDEKYYVGTASNVKAARKLAAKSFLTSVYSLKFDS